MDPRPYEIMRRELQRLLDEMSAGKQPSNGELHQAAWQAVQPMIRREVRGWP
jgi:hypothetical protein